MKTQTRKTAKKSSSKKVAPKPKAVSDEYGMEESKLMKLFEDELKDIYWVEKALTKAIPQMAKKTTDNTLLDALESHLKETQGHVTKVEEVFDIIGKKAQAKKCDAMEGLIKEGKDIMESSDKGAMRDAGIISAAQKIEHYEIASYGTLRAFAQTLGLNDAATILEEILDEEKEADLKLSEIAESTINIHAAEEEED